MRLINTVLLLCLGAVSYGGSITVTSTGFTVIASVNAPDTLTGSLLDISGPFSQTYQLLVTGGSGTGLAFLNYQLEGTTNEGVRAWQALDGIASIQVDTPNGHLGASVPSIVPSVPEFHCPVLDANCILPFVFGQPELITVTLSARALALPLAPDHGSAVVTAMADFRGIAFVSKSLGDSAPFLGAAVSLTAVPEPSSLGVGLLTLGAIVSWSRLRGRLQRRSVR